MAAPKMVRVLRPDLLSEKACQDELCERAAVRRFARDCLTGKTRVLAATEPWTAKGMLVKKEDVYGELLRCMPRMPDDTDSEMMLDEGDDEESDLDDGYEEMTDEEEAENQMEATEDKAQELG